ncbi:LIC_10190 family membrane protein [Leptospira santarosai]|uniref:LIC_10190 family membrane protein n=1 Tax=Leptospira santarosai TaxID=28183 RepID=UPI0002BEB702|nr:hypothetical protein [Leptospira santarosai]EMJ47123.1 putative membrane protein [Leptospira santarosai str. HAI1349]EMO22105.1 putative membrane protein [Leptospira santarosai str. HAI134]
MLAILTSSVLSLYLFIPLGSVVEKITKVKFQFTDRVFIGLSVTNTLVSFVSLFFPISGSVLLIFLIFCSILLCFLRKSLKLVVSNLICKSFVLILTFPIVLFALIFSLNPPMVYDSGLYHIQSIKWIQEYSIVPGLANVHGRFGFNPNVFTVFALTSLKDVFHQEIFSVNFTVYFILVLHYVNKIIKISKQEGFTSSFLLNLIVFVTILDQFINLSSPTPDLISIVFPLYVFTNLPKDTNSDLSLRDYLPTIVLSSYTISVKLATVPLFLLALILMIRFKSERKKLFWIISGITFILLPWLTRNLILSGYLIYPFPTIDLFDFDWKVPVDKVISEKLTITGWARNPGEGFYEASRMSLRDWFPIWWKNLSLSNQVFVVVSILFPIVALAFKFFKNVKLGFQTSIVLFTSWVGVVFWIFLAPDLRFGKAFLVIATVSPLFYLNFKIGFHWIRISKSLSKIIRVFFLIVILGFLIKGKVYSRSKRFIQENFSLLILPKKIEVPQNLDFKRIKIRNSDLDIFVPTEGDQCFDHKIPCMPYMEYTFTPRGPTLQSGFKSIQN